MVGIRLRTDSTGSAKSAFYKGTIVASSKHSTNKTDEKNSKRHNRGICKERKIPSLPKTFQRGSSGWGLPEMQGEMSSLLPDSLIASSSGYCHPNVSSYGLQEPFPTYTNAQVRGESLAAMSDRSMQSLGESFRDEERAFGSISSLKRIWSLRRDFTSARGAGFFLEEAPSIDDTELNGVSLDLDHSPIASPTKSISSLIEDLDYHSFSHNPPAPSLPSHHSSQIDFGHQYPSYWTHIPHHASTVKQSQHQHDTKRQSNEHDEQNPDTLSRSMFVNYFWNFFNIADWLTVDMIHDDRSFAALLRLILYNPIYPEFTSLQQFSWAVILGIMMGILTAVWKSLIEFSVDLVWKTVPEILLDWGVFTDLDGPFPVYHYMWITPSLFGGVLSYIFASLPKKIPSQNDWIHSLHSRGVQESDTFGLLFLLSTAGMASGLSLGPELPLILTSGMVGSWLGILCKQSILSARVLNLTAASAAIGGFFGFPMAGALFVLEVPHRTGLQYFEALSPATISSIVAVLTNRLATGNDITGYYKYPFLNDSLPSSIFHDAIFFGLFGGAIGMVYTNVILKLKGFVHDLFHEIKDQTHQQKVEQDLTHITVSTEESSCPFHGVEVTSSMEKDYYPFTRHKQEKMLRLVIAHEPTRAGVTGAIVGIIVGMTCMFIPHVMFWGESQLQNLIDKGNTPLPVFGRGDEPSAGLVALGFCMVDRTSADGAKFGFSLGCSAAIALAKIFVTGLSIGTGIVGGHFWAPLFVGCAASHFLTDSVSILASALGVSISLSAYPCVALLCTMGSCHVVAFRAHMAIILILTLTIDAFDPKDGAGGTFRAAGDYSAVFPLLTVSVFVALQVSRQTIFYEKQRSRGDILALPEVLCEPGKDGRPLVMDYEGNLHEIDESNDDYESDEISADSKKLYMSTDDGATQKEIEAQFNAQLLRVGTGKTGVSSPSKTAPPSPLPPRPREKKGKRSPQMRENPKSRQFDEGRVSTSNVPGPSQTLDELLSASLGNEAPILNKTHRRTRSEPFEDCISMTTAWGTGKSFRERKSAGVSTLQNIGKMPISLKRVSSFGQVDQEQPSLLDQARNRAASFASGEKSKKIQSKGITVSSGSPRLQGRKKL